MVTRDEEEGAGEEWRAMPDAGAFLGGDEHVRELMVMSTKLCADTKNY